MTKEKAEIDTNIVKKEVKIEQSSKQKKGNGCV